MMSRHNARGFTLVEMMIVITIIGLLAGLTLPALNAARTAAKIAKTKTLVTRLHYIVMDQYDSYRTRRPAMDLEAYARAAYGADPSGRVSPYKMARARVNAIRDLIRLEMPDRWTDVADDPANPQKPKPLVLNYCPSLSQRYFRLYWAAWNAAKGDPVKEGKVAENAAAECLYMIVMSIPGAAEQFHASDIGDVDNDGLPEFIDAWGRPIRFLRWPAGFVPPVADGNLQDVNTPDPFDPRRILAYQGDFALYPLIYSAGPDGEYDINIGLTGSGESRFPTSYALDSQHNVDPFQNDGNGKKYGQPLNDEDGTETDLQHYDNIHNHRLETGRGGT
ncbi:MAG: prepilin-type N-terminal cleavage/methylation domain-containing protein [Planctomycetia bacterium]|nr:prepilin-type N-terminal cleavage/methylation domain-containing protein [Planctomycetia bacterium]